MKKIFLLLLMLFVSGCATTNIGDASNLSRGKGIMLTNFQTNTYGYKVTIINKKNLTVASAIFEIVNQDNLRVISLPAGKYTWRGIYIGTNYAEFRDQFDFDILDGQINYVGDVVLDINKSDMSYKIGFKNSTLTLSEFKIRYPALAKSLPIREDITASNNH